MDSYFNRQAMLTLAVGHHAGAGTAAEVVATAEAFNNFCSVAEGGAGIPEALSGPLAGVSAAQGVAAQSAQAAPRRGRPRREAASTAPAASDAAATPAAAATQPASDASAAATESSDDDFLSESPTPAAAEPEKKYELKDVRAALVELQSKVSKEKAMEVLGKHTAPQPAVLGNLKPESFASVIKDANEAAKQGK